MSLCPAIAFPPWLDPILLQLGPLTIHWYGVGYMVGILFCLFYSKALLSRPALWPHEQAPMAAAKLEDFLVLAVLGIVVGGRLGEVLLWDPRAYFTPFWRIFAVWEGGMSFHGGLIGMIIAMLIFAKKHHINPWSMFDTIVPGVPLGIGVVRLCNFINQELWGNVTSLPFGVCFPTDPLYLPRHPSQIYEALLEGALLFIVLSVAVFRFRALKYRGFVAGLFLFGYASARALSELFRAPIEDPTWFSLSFGQMGLTYGMALSAPMFLIGAYAMLRATIVGENN